MGSMLAFTKEERGSISAAAMFDGQVALAEYEYDRTISHLLKACDVASKHKNKALLKELSGVTKAWMKYFGTIKTYLTGATKGEKTPNAKKVICFVDGQIKFFDTMSREIDREIKSLK